MKYILAVINDWPNAESILSKASEIASAIHGKVYVYCPIYSELEEMNRYVGFENFEEVKAELIEECKSRLDELPGIEKLESEVSWQTRVYKAVADKADEISAEMIVMGRSSHSVLGDFLHKPDDWHLLRDSSCPVLILNQKHQNYHAVIAALDVMEDSDYHQGLNARVLDEAQMLSELLRLPLKVVTVVPEPAYIYSDIAVVDSAMVTKFRNEALDLARERQHQVLNRLGVHPHSAQVVTGSVRGELQKFLSENGLLVIGTIANKGLKGFFIGNTSERLLSHLDGDMLVVN